MTDHLTLMSEERIRELLEKEKRLAVYETEKPNKKTLFLMAYACAAEAYPDGASYLRRIAKAEKAGGT